MSYPREVLAEVHERAGDYCEACGLPGHHDRVIHHRLLRSAGGKDTVENLMYVHSACHNVAPGSIHQNPQRSYRLYHMLRRGQDPATSPPPIAVRDLATLRA